MIRLTLATSLLALSLHAPADPIAGRWVLDAEAGDNPTEAIDDVVRSVNRFARGRARGRLTPAMTPPTTLELRLDDEAVVVSSGDGRSMRVVPGGEEVSILTEEGESARLTAERDGVALVLRISSERGNRLQTMEPIEDALIVTTVYDFDFAPQPVRLRSVYRRKGA